MLNSDPVPLIFQLVLIDIKFRWLFVQLSLTFLIGPLNTFIWPLLTQTPSKTMGLVYPSILLIFNSGPAAVHVLFQSRVWMTLTSQDQSVSWLFKPKFFSAQLSFVLVLSCFVLGLVFGWSQHFLACSWLGLEKSKVSLLLNSAPDPHQVLVHLTTFFEL